MYALLTYCLILVVSTIKTQLKYTRALQLFGRFVTYAAYTTTALRLLLARTLHFFDL